MAGHKTARLLTDGDVPFSELVPGLELSRAITHAGTTQLGGGYMRFDEDSEFADWTLSYDEVLFVQSGELEIVGEGGSVKAGRGGGHPHPQWGQGHLPRPRRYGRLLRALALRLG